ncbi:MAG: hypothetical protein U0793_18525 [Gemmataceae bacterium]
MFRRATAGIVAIFILAGAFGAAGAGEKDKEVKGVVVKVDTKASTLTIKIDGGKEKTYDINDKTKFVGPKGGASDAGLKDDRLAPGAEVRLEIATNNRTCHVVHLPERKKK